MRPNGPMCVAGVLRRAAARLADAGSATPRLDAEVLLMDVLGRPREYLYRSPEEALEASDTERFEALVARRARGEPAAYLTGTREFWSLDFRVTLDVLIPRPETEHLVEAALAFLGSRAGPRRILDLGTGSGAVAVCVARECTRAEVWATDVSGAALAVARENARRHGVGGRIQWLQGDLFAPLEGAPDSFDAMVSNPPYIPSGDLARLPRDVGAWEPALALDGGADGMDFYRRIVREGVPRLREGGLLALEVGGGLAGRVAGLLRAHRELGRVRMRRDYAGLPRVVAAERTRPSEGGRAPH